MTFLYPTFLWGLLALAIPIIVHLFNFRRAKKIYFSNVSFLEQVKESSNAKRKLKHWLVLCCRLLAIAFLVFAFAQPFLPGKEQGMNSRMVSIFLDNSQSMSNTTPDDLSGLNSGIAYLEKIVELYPNETKFRIVTNDFAPSSLHPKSKQNALELATELDYSNLYRNKATLLQNLMPAPNRANAEDIYLISDFQRATFGTGESTLADSTHHYKLIPIRYADEKNIFVDSLYLENPFLISGETNKLHVKIKNIGTEDAAGVVTRLFVNGSQSATTSIDINKNTSTEISFDINFELNDINECKITLEDFPITFDNEHFFTLNLLKKINICEVYGPEASPYIHQVYADNELFSFQRFENGNLNYATAQSADLFIFNEVSRLDNSLINLAKDLLSKGKSVLVVPAPNSQAQELQTLSGLAIAPYNGASKLDLAKPDLSNPYFENIFTELDNKTEMPGARPLINWPATGITILKTKNGLPYLSQFNQSGTLYMIASPLQDEFTGFHKHALFVPVLYRMAALSNNSHQPLSFSTDQASLVLRIDSLSTGGQYKLHKEGQEFIPQQRINGNKLILDIPRFLLEPGFYALRLNGNTKNILAFNHSKLESDPSLLSHEEIQQEFSRFENAEVMDNPDAQSFSQNMKERYQGKQLWKYALVLSLIFLLIETLFIRFL